MDDEGFGDSENEGLKGATEATSFIQEEPTSTTEGGKRWLAPLPLGLVRRRATATSMTVFCRSANKLTSLLQRLAQQLEYTELLENAMKAPPKCNERLLDIAAFAASGFGNCRIKGGTGANSYNWGKTGHDSTVARFASATADSKFTIQADKPYAENLLDDNQALLSSSIVEAYGQKLPLLFTVLSIQEALGIQAHPHKELAGRLHEANPKHYPDENHKPEMTIALTPFTGFYAGPRRQRQPVHRRKVSHCPIVMACHAESENRFYTQSPISTQNFWWKFAEPNTSGRVRVKIPPAGDSFSWTLPTSFPKTIIAEDM
ncbi:Mannose-6-phosphate isomerase [Rhizina undulata]